MYVGLYTLFIQNTVFVFFSHQMFVMKKADVFRQRTLSGKLFTRRTPRVFLLQQFHLHVQKL